MKTMLHRLLGIARQRTRQLSYKNYHAAKAYYRLHLYLSSLKKKETLLLYQMGKVGSTTIAWSLKALNLDMPVYHVHFLTQEFIDRNKKDFIENFSPENARSCRHLWESQYLRKQIDKGLKGKKWKIVTLTREPISRNISAFFQSLQVERVDSTDRYRIKSAYGFDITIDIQNIQDLIKLFLEKFDHDTPLVFFDREFKGVLGIDVFSSDFPKSKGYKIYEQEFVDVLLIRLENLDQCASKAFQEFLNVDGFTVIRKNISSHKAYYPIYLKFLDSIHLPDSYINEMYTSKYARHFYCEQEIDAFRAKWHKRKTG